jgi:hypothetical protein
VNVYQQRSLEWIFYKLFRCQLLHEAGMAMDVEFLDDVPETALSIRAGGAPEYVLKLSPGWFHALVRAALDVV